MDVPIKLIAERQKLKRRCLALCIEFAHAEVCGLTTAQDLRQGMMAYYDRLGALDLVIASYDPQGVLFLDGEDRS